jgi:hypothetical protein
MATGYILIVVLIFLFTIGSLSILFSIFYEKHTPAIYSYKKKQKTIDKSLDQFIEETEDLIND